MSRVGSSHGGSTYGRQSTTGRSRGASSVHSGSTGTGSKKTSSHHRRSSSSSSEDVSDDELDAEDSLESQLVPCLASCSRQKMRAIHMALKRMGNNDNRISSKDFYQILTNEYGIKFTPRVVQIIQETFEDNQGIQYEKIFKCMEGAHQRTGRDSVDAALARNDLQTRKTTKTLQEWMEELISRVEEQVSRADVFLDFEDLRKRMEEKDVGKSGLLSKQDLLVFCNEPSFPVYGALLNAIIKHCENESDSSQIKWPAFIEMLEKGQTRFTEANPEMRRALTTRPKGGIIKGPGEAQPSNQAAAKKRATVKVSVDGLSENTEATGDLQPVPSTDDAPDALDSQFGGDSSTSSGNQIRFLVDKQTLENATKVNWWNRVSHSSERHTKKQPVPCIAHVVSGTNIETEVQVYKPSKEPPSVLKADDDPDTSLSPAISSKEGAKLQLEWIYGCRANDCRNSLHILANGELCYFLANVAILYNPNSHAQRFYRGHSDEIKSMNVHPNKRFIVATGQNGYDETIEYKPSKQAVVRVWRGDTLETLAVLGGGMLVKSVLCIAFHPDRDVLAAVDAGPSKYVCLWDFNKQICLTSCQIRVDLLCDMAFSPKITETFVTCGKDHLAWWKVNCDIGTFTHLYDANYQANMKPRYVVCMTFTEKGDLITGDSNGNIYFWATGGNTILTSIQQAHLGSIYHLTIVRNSLISSGRDAFINNWPLSGGKTESKTGDIQIPNNEGAPRVVVARERHLIIATTTNSILSATLSPGQWPLTLSRLNGMPITEGHFDAVHGLAIPKLGNLFLTAGCDGALALFDANQRRPVFKQMIAKKSELSDDSEDETTTTNQYGYERFVSIDVSHDARQIAVATKEVNLVMIKLTDDFELVEEWRYKLENVVKISIVRFSKDCQRIAVGTSKGEIHVFGKSVFDSGQGKATWDFIGICQQVGIDQTNIPLAVTAIDWTIDIIHECYFLRASFHNTDYAIYNATSCQPINPVDASDYAWATHTCLLAWDRVGVFEHKATRETGVRSLDIQPIRQSCLVVSDYATNKLTLFKYPCTKGEIPSQAYLATLDISTLRFTATGSYVITVGGKDSTIIQWKIV